MPNALTDTQIQLSGVLLRDAEVRTRLMGDDNTPMPVLCLVMQTDGRCTAPVRAEQVYPAAMRGDADRAARALKKAYASRSGHPSPSCAPRWECPAASKSTAATRRPTQSHPRRQHMPMLDPVIVALTGPAGAGKDTVADYLVEHNGYIKLAFADALRDEVGRAFDVSIQLLTQRETKEHPMSALALRRCMDNEFVNRIWVHLDKLDLSAPRSPRQIMQWWGTEYRRANNPHYWLDALTTRFVRAHRDGQNRFVVTDVRNANEAELLRELGASLWQLTRPGFAPQPGAHSTETTGAEFNPDHQLVNDHSITHLHKQAYALLSKLGKAQEAA